METGMDTGVFQMLAGAMATVGVFALGLLFLAFIFYPVLGFGNIEYIGPAGEA